MEEAKLAWALLLNSTGAYRGRGVNHEGQNYTGGFELETSFPGKTLSLSSTAVGDEGETFHAEVSWVGFDITGVLTLYVASNNHPAITPHPFHRVEETLDAKNIVFRFGNPEIRQSFREEITISFFTDGSVAHQYAWGMPGGDFLPRSGSRMEKL